MTRKAVLLETVLAAWVLLAGVFLVAVPLLGQGGLGLNASVWQPMGEPLSVRAQLSAPVVEGLSGGPFGTGEAVELSGPTTVTASVQDPDLVQRLTLVGSQVVTGLATVAVLLLLLRIVRSVRTDPFVAANARRLRLVAVLVAVGGTGAQLLHSVGAVRVLDAARVRGSVTPVFEVSFLPLVAALGIGVLAEVFRHGTALREDLEGLV